MGICPKRIYCNSILELRKAFFRFITASLRHLDDVVGNSLAEWSAFAASDDVTNLHITEAGRQMN